MHRMDQSENALGLNDSNGIDNHECDDAVRNQVEINKEAVEELNHDIDDVSHCLRR